MNKILKIILSLFFVLSFFKLLPETQVLATSVTYINPVSWKTDSGQFSSGNFYIRIRDKYFYAPEPVSVQMPTGDKYSTIELIWKEKGQEMRVFMYFKMVSSGMWEMYDLRTYNYEGKDWIYYSTKDTLGNPVSSLPGHRNFYAERVFKPLDTNIDAEIYCKDCSITTFSKKLVPISEYGYGVEFNTGLPSSQTITITTDPMTGYGVNVKFIDSNRSIVKDQSDFRYEWRSSNSSVVAIYSQALQYDDGSCAYEINPPCPMMNVQISGKSVGIATIYLDMVRISDGKIVASGDFEVKVVNKINEPVYGSPVPTADTNLNEELKSLKNEVGRIDKELRAQTEEVSLLKRIVLSIQSFLQKVFRFKN